MLSTPEIREALFVHVKALEEVHCSCSHWTHFDVSVPHVPDVLELPVLVRFAVLTEEH